MGHLALSSGIPNFSKAIFSIWFRVPQSSIDSVSASSFTPIMNKILPLVTFGRVQKITNSNVRFVNAITPANSPASTDFVATPVGIDRLDSADADPCYIGLSCVGGVAKLVFNIQMAGFANEISTNLWVGPCAGYTFGGLPTAVSAGYDPSPGTGWEQDGATPTYCKFSSIVDLTSQSSGANGFTPEQFLINSPTVITADIWHHLLLSVDLSSDCSVHSAANPMDGSLGQNATTADGTVSYCKLWYAIDDVNRSGEANLSPSYVDGSSDPNAILTLNTHSIANFRIGTVGNLFAPQAFGNYPARAVPATGGAFGIPAGPAFSNKIQIVDMSRPFQVFTGISLDTSIEANRRLFIDADKHPVLSSVAKDALGAPAVLFNSNKNWKSGNNTGTAGRFSPTGSINDFSPGP